MDAATLSAAALAILLVWASYGFRYQMYRHYEPGQVRSLVGLTVTRLRNYSEGLPFIPAVELTAKSKATRSENNRGYSRNRPAGYRYVTLD